ncbi:MAG: MFS transporter [Acidimicrobiales bacterium]
MITDKRVGTAADKESAHLGLALAVIASAQLMLVLDASIVNVALPTIHRQLHFSEANLEWLVTAYALTFGGLLLFGGRTGDLYGKRRMFMVGIAIFAGASLLSGLAQNQEWLIVTRGLQGVGAAIASPTALSLVATNFPEGQQRNRAMGVYAAMSASGLAIGMLLGGVLTSYASWRWIFFINVPIAAAGLVLAPRALKESPGRPGHLDAPGAVTVTGGMIALVFSVTNATSHGWGALGTLLPLVAAAVLLASFLAIEGVQTAPLMPLSIFANRNRAGAYAIMLALGTSTFAVFFFLIQYLQDVHHYSPIRAGLAFLPVAAALMGTALFTARVITRIGIRVPLLIGPALVFAGMAWLTRLTASSDYLDLLGPLLVLALGMAQCFVPLTVTTVAGVKDNETGLASALLNTAQQIGGAVGLAVLGTVSASAISSRLAASHGHLNAAAAASATTHGYTDAFTVAALLTVAAFIVSVTVIRVTNPVPAPRANRARTTGQSLVAPGCVDNLVTVRQAVISSAPRAGNKPSLR